MKCINGDVQEYKTKQVCLRVCGKEFMCMLGIVPQLDCLIVLGWDCPS